MMRLIHGIVLLGLAFALTSCGSSYGTGPDSKDIEELANWYDPGQLMKERIQEHIDQLPYQRGDELVKNLQWIAQQGEASVPFLLKALKNDKPKMRSNAACALGYLGDRRVLPRLRKHLDDNNPMVRFEVARTMIAMGDVTPMNVLIAGLDSDSQYVRYLCISALQESTGKTFGYDHRTKTAAERRASIAQWQGWWEKRNQDEWFQQGGAKGVPAAPSGR
ncbi:MAG: hypothetical protein CSA62_14460 [Planctomycetota bacterium]|nr:MAG: hypothetical protein CSA62_14460 [Planctomycetota bacterium]